MAVFTEDQCAAGECLIECVSCNCTIHLDDSEDFPLCEDCCSEEPILSMLSHDDWADRIGNHLGVA